MKGVLTGDIINSRKLPNTESWLLPLKEELQRWGDSPGTWEIFRGDSFQLLLDKPEDTLKAALLIKAVMKSTEPVSNRHHSPVDVRIAIGIGAHSYSNEKVVENNGEAFVFSGELIDEIKKDKRTLAIRTPWEEQNKDLNLIFQLLSIPADNWTVSSAQMMKILLETPQIKQKEIGNQLGIQQNTVNYGLKRAHADIVVQTELLFREKLLKLCQ